MKNSNIKKVVLSTSLVMALLAGCSTEKKDLVKEKTPVKEEIPDANKEITVHTFSFYDTNRVELPEKIDSYNTYYLLVSKQPIDSLKADTDLMLNDTTAVSLSTNFTNDESINQNNLNTYPYTNLKQQLDDESLFKYVIIVSSSDEWITDKNVVERALKPLMGENLGDIVEVYTYFDPDVQENDPIFEK